MTDDEFGKKIEEAAYLLRVVVDGPNSWDMSVGPEQTRLNAREQLGKVVREILTEGIRTWLDTPLVADQTSERQ